MNVSTTSGDRAPGRSAAGGAGALTQLFREAGRPLLMPYAVGGYPDAAGCLRIVDCYLQNGADLVELGIPFSDPLADGPVIQGASQVALRSGVRPGDVLDIAGEASKRGAKLVLLSYLNTILAFGPERFFERCQSSGVLGVVVPDVPVEEAAELQATAKARGVDVILLAAPTSTDERLARIAAAASGFIYCVSNTGVTGARSSLRQDLPDFIARLRRHTDLPLSVGFGVSTVEQLAEVGRYLQQVRSTPSFSR
jgi:tryptophan synthase alpha chain